MQLGVRDAAAILNVSEKTIYRWLKKNLLPAYVVNDQYRFNRGELLEWATARKIGVSSEIYAEPADDGLPGLAEALQVGGIFYSVTGGDKSSVLASTVELMPLPTEVDRKFLLEVLLARESLGSTGIGDGIAIPHVRNPIVMHIPRPMVTLCFLREPVAFDAIDNKPVHTLFAIVSPTIRAHLHLLSRLAFALKHPAFLQALSARVGPDELLRLCRMAEDPSNELSEGAASI
jgi:PTS system nitrogen regulatory IIA component